MSERIFVFDTTLRDGEQAAGVCFSRRDKIEIAARLDALRVDIIEAGFPAASAAELAAVAAVAREVKDAAVCALARAVAGDVDAAGQALRGARRPRIHVFVNSSDVQLAQQLRKSRKTCSRWRAPRSRARVATRTTSSSARWTPPAPTSISSPRWCRSRWMRAPPPSTSPTPSAGSSPTGWRRCCAACASASPSSRKPCSPSTARTTWAWRPPTAWPRWAPARARSSLP